MESMLGDVEISLLALEDTIDAREMQEKQLEQRFQLAMYQERRKAEFNELANRLQNDFEKKKRLQQNSSSSNALKKIGNYAENRLRERQENYQSSSASGTIWTFLYAYICSMYYSLWDSSEISLKHGPSFKPSENGRW